MTNADKLFSRQLNILNAVPKGKALQIGDYLGTLV